MKENFACVVCGKKEPDVTLTKLEDKHYCEEHLEQGQQDLSVAQLSARFPNQDSLNLYMLDNIERLLTNSRDQTSYLKSIKGILTFFLIIVILNLIVSLFL